MRIHTIVGLLFLAVVGFQAGDSGGAGQADRIEQLVGQLGDKEFAKRDTASRELNAIGEPALGALRKAAAGPDAEVRRRAELIIESIMVRVRAAAAKADLEALRGTWYTVSVNNQGAITGLDKTSTITYDGTKYTQRDGGHWSEGTIKIIDAKANPKQIDYLITDGSNKGLQVQSIYSVDGEDHHIVSRMGNRPTEFSGKAGFYRVMRRAKPEDLRPPEIQLESAVFVTDLVVPESRAAVRRLWLKCRPADGEAGTLTLDPTAPKFDAFGEPAPADKATAPVAVEVTLKLLKEERGRKLFELRGAKLTSRLSLVVYPGITPWGDGRLLVHAKDGQVRYALDLRLPRQEVLHPPCHPGCFPAGTRVVVQGGTTAIERIREGDLVTTIDAGGKPSPAKVTGVFVTRNRVLEVRTEGGMLVTTETQPVGLEGGGFRAAGELKQGDRIWRWVDGRRRVAIVTAITAADQEAEVFNLVLGEPTGFVAGGFVVRSKPPLVEAVRP